MLVFSQGAFKRHDNTQLCSQKGFMRIVENTSFDNRFDNHMTYRNPYVPDEPDEPDGPMRAGPPLRIKWSFSRPKSE